MAVKTLSAVEVDSYASNQHEFHGVQALKYLFGYDRQYFDAECFYLDNNGIDRTSANLTWYDARENSFDRSEYRLYYNSDFINYKANPGDKMILTVDDQNMVRIFIIANGTQLDSFLISILRHRIDNTYQIVNDIEMNQILDDVIPNI